VRRSTGELLVLMIAGTVCSAILLSGAFLAVFALIHPDRDLSTGFDALAGVLNTLVGLVAGFLAGRTDMSRRTKADE